MKSDYQAHLEIMEAIARLHDCIDILSPDKEWVPVEYDGEDTTIVSDLLRERSKRWIE